jgi:acyl carrier protein
VFHAAAAMSSALLGEMTERQLDAMLAAKVDGTLVLHEVTRERNLDAFVLFSSTTALLGVAGLGHYAAANQFMDVFAHYRAALGFPALAVNWGTWEIMRVATDEDRKLFARAGLRPLAAASAFEALARLLTARAVQATVADVDWIRLKSTYEAKRSRPFLEAVGAQAPRPAGDSQSAQRTNIVETMRAMPRDVRRDALVGHVLAATRTVLKLDASRQPDLGEGFFDMGMDSLMAVELKTTLETVFEHSLPSTLTFNYPNIQAVAEFLESEFGFDPSAAPVDAGRSIAQTQPVAQASAALATSAGLDKDDFEEQLAAKLRALGFE